MKVKAWAPGKAIISGEHFVVYGSYAVAAAIPRGVLCTAEDSQELVVISRDLGITAKPPNDVPDRLKPVVASVQEAMKYLGSSTPMRITIESEIQTAAGLGSSSATAVAAVAACISFLGWPFASSWYDELPGLAMVSEKIVHGKPSGIDIAVANHGGVILFRKPFEVRKVKMDKALEFVIAYTGIPRDTSKMISRVAETGARHQAQFDSLVKSSSRLGLLVAESMEKGQLEILGSLLNFFHAALRSLGASTEKVEELVEGALAAGAIGAKVTGGGGGGCIIALPNEGESQSIEDALKSRAQDAFTAKLPSGGLRVWRETD